MPLECICVIFRGLFFEHNPGEIGYAFHRAGAEIGPRLNIKCGFNWASKKTVYGWTLFKMQQIPAPILACGMKFNVSGCQGLPDDTDGFFGRVVDFTQVCQDHMLESVVK